MAPRWERQAPRSSLQPFEAKPINRPLGTTKVKLIIKEAVAAAGLTGPLLSGPISILEMAPK
jgi:hypothetical protein